MSDPAVTAITVMITAITTGAIAAIPSIIIALRTSKQVKDAAAETSAKLDVGARKTDELHAAVNGELAKRIASEVAAATAQGELKGQATERAQSR